MSHGIRIVCDYCSPEAVLMQMSPSLRQDPIAWCKAWKSTLTGAPGGNPQFSALTCACGSTYTLEDDGISAEDGGCLSQKNVSAPLITSVSVAGGLVKGGTRLLLSGQALDVGTLVVHFGSHDGIVLKRTSSTAEVSVPSGGYKLFVDGGTLSQILISPRSGNFTVGEHLTFVGTGVIGQVCAANAGDLVVEFVTPSDLDSLVGLRVTGSQSSSSGTVSNVSTSSLIPGETLLGVDSKSMGTIESVSPLLVFSPTGKFSPGEIVKGQGSGACVRLKATNYYSGTVDICVSNEFGERLDGSSELPGSFTYV